jgi:hypothetical protein
MNLTAQVKKSTIEESLLSGVTGTTAMTAYSYLVSDGKEKWFKEPEILNQLLFRIQQQRKISVEKEKHHIAGFLLHYCTGTLFSGFYHAVWKKKFKANGLLNGLAFGLTFGLLGISIWKTVFKLHPHPPKIDLKSYIGHLIIAHLIFGTFVVQSSAIADKFIKK